MDMIQITADAFVAWELSKTKAPGESFTKISSSLRNHTPKKYFDSDSSSDSENTKKLDEGSKKL